MSLDKSGPGFRRAVSAYGQVPLLRLSVTTSPEAEEAVAELLGRVLHSQPASYLDVETRRLTVSVYLADKSVWSPGTRAALREGLDAIQRAGLNTGQAVIRASRLPARNWAEAWKRHFRPLTIGRKLLVLPGWIKRKPLPGQKTVVLDPGLSFGTGHHPTTCFCLKAIVRASQMRRVPPGAMTSFLDLGTGSGILAIAAAKLGFLPVHAVENDPVAVQVARENARRNQVQDKICLVCENLRRFKPDQRYSIVCANLITGLLIAERKCIARMVEPGGTLVLAGILAAEFSQVVDSYKDVGAVLKRDETRQEWRSGEFLVNF